MALSIALILGMSTAYAQSDSQRWEEATKRMGAGNDAEAAQLLLSLKNDFPDSTLADDALFLAAQLLESKLGDPTGAKAAYQTLVNEYPNSRSALAAQRHLKALQKSLGPNDEGAAPQADFQNILSEFPNRSPSQSIDRAQALLRKYPSWTGRAKVLYWLAELARRQNRFEDALGYYHQVQSEGASRDLLVQSLFSIVEIQIRQEEHAGAESTLQEVASRSDLSSGELQVVDELRSKLAKSIRQTRTLLLSMVTYAAMLMVLLGLHWRHSQSSSEFFGSLRRPPIEFYYLLPFAALFVIMAMTGHEEVGPAILIISAGSLLVTWVAGTTMASMQPFRLKNAIVCASLATAATASLCYYALYRSHLLELVATTITFGPE